MTTATEIRAQLAEAWENAERVAPQEGDAYIGRGDGRDGHYSIGVAHWELDPNRYRVLERAKPKPPEWEAVVASHISNPGHPREVYVRTPGRVDDWESSTRYANHDDLVDPVPLVEMPDKEDLAAAILRGEFVRRAGRKGPAPRGHHEADAVLELLSGERKA